MSHIFCLRNFDRTSSIIFYNGFRSLFCNYGIHRPASRYLMISTTNRKEQFETADKMSMYSKKAEDWGDLFTRWYKQYQDFVGISAILEAQERVTQLSSQLLAVQTQRRQLQKEVQEINQQLIITHQSINKSELYSEDHYALFEKARVLSSSLKDLQQQFSKKEEEERDLFTYLTAAIKYCHEKERTHSEQAKYWSVLLSVVSAALASVITSLNNWVRIKEIKDHASHLHEEAMNKSKELVSIISTKIIPKGEDSEVKPEDSFSENISQIQEIIKEELGKLSLPTFEVVNTSDTNMQEAQDISYVKVMSCIALGAAFGTLITAIVFGSYGGGG